MTQDNTQCPPLLLVFSPFLYFSMTKGRLGVSSVSNRLDQVHQEQLLSGIFRKKPCHLFFSFPFLHPVLFAFTGSFVTCLMKPLESILRVRDTWFRPTRELKLPSLSLSISVSSNVGWNVNLEYFRETPVTKRRCCEALATNGSRLHLKQEAVRKRPGWRSMWTYIRQQHVWLESQESSYKSVKGKRKNVTNDLRKTLQSPIVRR